MTTALEQRYQRLRQELMGGLLALGGLSLLGTLWYRLVEGWTWLDAVYMTVITLTTVGFGEINRLGSQGRLFTIGLIISGVISIGFIVNRFTTALIEGYFQQGILLQRQRRLMDALSQHYILCGFGRTGHQIALEFSAEGISFVVIDNRPEMVQDAQELGYVAIQGDVTQDEVLVRVGIERAVCVVAALGSDAENLYTVLSAKALNPQVRAIARASMEEAIPKLQRAGADAVVSPYITGGRRMAAAALRPQVMDFVDGVLSGSGRPFYMEEVRLEGEAGGCIGKTLRETHLRSRTGALILAIRRIDDTLIVGPNANTVLHLGDLVICMGTAEQLRHFNQLLGSPSGRSLRPPKHTS